MMMEGTNDVRTRPTINQAILTAMREASHPLSPREAYDHIVAKGLYEFHAQRPEDVVKGQIRRHCKDLDFPTAESTKYFGMASDGRFYALETALRSQQPGRGNRGWQSAKKPSLSSTLRQLKALHALHRELISQRVLQELKRLPPSAFERFAKRLLEVYGFDDMRVTAATHDGGIDGYGRLKVGLAKMNVAFQCKRWLQNNVGRPEIDKFRGAIQGEYEQGIYFTTAHFASGAKDVSIKAGAVPIVLIDGPSIVDLMIHKSFGIEQESLPVFTYALDVILATDEESDTAL